MKKSMIYRVLIYIAGLLILAMGLTLNTKAGLGVSPIISVSYSVSEITHHNFRTMLSDNTELSDEKINELASAFMNTLPAMLKIRLQAT